MQAQAIDGGTLRQREDIDTFEPGGGVVAEFLKDTDALDQAIGVDRVWNESPKYLQGQGIGVAVVDSGMNPDNDFYTVTGKARLVTLVVLWSFPVFNSAWSALTRRRRKERA